MKDSPNCLPYLLSVSLLVFFCSGCRSTYLPPKRPFAGMYPTAMSISEMKEMHPVEMNIQTLEGHLAEMDLLKHLVNAGLTKTELQTVCRGLSQRGYAELDARRCENCPVNLVLFAGTSGDAAALRILAFVDGDRILKSWPAESAAASNAANAAPEE